MNHLIQFLPFNWAHRRSRAGYGNCFSFTLQALVISNHLPFLLMLVRIRSARREKKLSFASCVKSFLWMVAVWPGILVMKLKSLIKTRSVCFLAGNTLLETCNLNLQLTVAQPSHITTFINLHVEKLWCWHFKVTVLAACCKIQLKCTSLDLNSFESTLSSNLNVFQTTAHNSTEILKSKGN